ncbi:MAG: hypothetical protein HF982_10240 [Desulfobacteraceae bacterium]|nr:hypothetical protein [Desulfobacteraceae bacterium]MBC2719945.1 hypothetical protein [Desulfobacteraceae bacterium]
MPKVKSDDKKCFLLAEKIERIFRDGFILSDDIMHYINSTFSNPSINELEEIIYDKHNCERDPVIELIFFPDELVQIKLEEFLESKDFKKKDEEKILSYMLNKKLVTTIRFSESKDLLNFFVPKSSTIKFISRLNISRKLNKRLLKAIDKFVSDKLRTPVKVRLRNSITVLSENKIKFLSSFFEKLKVEKNYFFKCLDFVLDFFDRLKDDKNILQSLLDKKELYFQDLQKAVKFEELLNKNNMETLISRGVRIPYISKEDAMNNIVIIDTITLVVYSKQYSSPLER